MTLDRLWLQAEQSAPEKTALVDGARRFTYRQAGDDIRRIMKGLILRWRMPRRAVVAILAPNCVEFVISYFAAASSGAVVQPIDSQVEAFDPAKKKWSRAPIRERGVIEITLPPGGAVLLRW